MQSDFLSSITDPDLISVAPDPCERERVETRCEFLTGPAGSGKTFEIKRRIREDEKYGLLCSTTGISAVNLDTITLNSTLAYFDTDSLRSNYVSGRLHSKLREIVAAGHRHLVIDEVSMMDARQLDLIFDAVEEINEFKEEKLGLVVTGDFCQLPPVNAPFAFEANCWPQFAKNTTQLTKIWRQSAPGFLEGLALVRMGDGTRGVEVLQSAGVEFKTTIDTKFDGTTIMAKNDEAARYNKLRLASLQGEQIISAPRRWGRQKSEWKPEKELIPSPLVLRIGALVTVLVNDPPAFTYVNGDQGHVISYDPVMDTIEIELKRNGKRVLIPKIWRHVYDNEGPKAGEPVYRGEDPGGGPHGFPWYDGRKRQWVYGGIQYHPLRLGYAITTHRSQGLSLDAVQIDCRDHFFSSPGMLYVALSRARTAKGVRVVGRPEDFARRVKTAETVRRYL
jgi:ATP-dependent DNA helicase PIF1